MAEPSDVLTGRLAERLQRATDEVDAISAGWSPNVDLNERMKALADSHRVMLEAHADMLAMVAAEVDQLSLAIEALRRHQDPPS